MKKIIMIGVIFLTLTLFGCRMPVDKKTVEDNLVLDIMMLDERLEEQFYLEPEEVTFKGIVEGTYHLNYTLEWYVNDVLMERSSRLEFKYTAPVKTKEGNQVQPGRYEVYARIELLVEGELVTKESRRIEYKTVSLFGELKVQPQEGALALGEKLVSDILYEKDKTFDFISSFKIKSGKVTDEKYEWVLEKYDGNELIDSKVVGNLDTLSLSIKEEGEYRLFLKLGKFESNRIDIQVIYGKVTALQTILRDSAKIKLDYKVQVSSQIDKIEWFYIAKDGTETKLLGKETSEVVFTKEDNIEGLVYAKVTFKNGYHTITEKTLVATNFVTVSNEEELFEAVKTADRILVLNDITIQRSETLKIQKPLTMMGLINEEGKRPTISSHVGYKVIIRAESDDVWFKDLIISDSANYNLQYYRAKNGLVENVLFNSCGKGGSYTNPGSGLYVDGGYVKVLSAEVKETNVAGIRVEGYPDMKGSVHIERGKYIHDNSVWAPIASVRSNYEDLDILAPGYVVLNAPLGNNIIRVWSSENAEFSWDLIPPSKIEYFDGQVLDMADIKLQANLANEAITLNIDAVYMLMDKLTAKGILQIINAETKEVAIDAIIEGYDKDLPGDKLVYTYTDRFGQKQVEKPIVITGFEPGKYEVHITIGGGSDTLHLGFITIYVRR